MDPTLAKFHCLAAWASRWHGSAKRLKQLPDPGSQQCTAVNLVLQMRESGWNMLTKKPTFVTSVLLPKNAKGS